ncbi:hypothetical protein GCM10009804_73930 [Kribbella hippodromi]|uniref:Uncharacterized protein n=1 Tax=Kribbella hippodromi TaxID=434347 RepID=A0ABN2EJN2_9ACTN
MYVQAPFHQVAVVAATTSASSPATTSNTQLCPAEAASSPITSCQQTACPTPTRGRWLVLGVDAPTGVAAVVVAGWGTGRGVPTGADLVAAADAAAVEAGVYVAVAPVE